MTANLQDPFDAAAEAVSPAPAPPAAPTKGQVDAVYARLLTKAGNDPAKLSRALVRQAIVFRDRLGRADAQLAALESGSGGAGPELPEGHVAIPRADAELFAAYKALGTPEELAGLSERETNARAALAAIDRKDQLAAVARAAGYDADVLADLAEGKTFVPAKDVTGQGRDSFNVKDTGPDGKERVRALAEVEVSEWRKYLPSLRRAAAAAAAPGASRGWNDQPPRPQAAAPFRGSSAFTGVPPGPGERSATQKTFDAAAEVAMGL